MSRGRKGKTRGFWIERIKQKRREVIADLSTCPDIPEHELAALPMRSDGTRLAHKLELDRRRELMARFPTKAEKDFANRLQRAGIEYVGQKPLGPFFADFFIPSLGAVVELDGGYHKEDEQARKDRWRDDVLASFGLTVFRIDNAKALRFDLAELTRLEPRTAEWADGVVRQIEEWRIADAKRKGLYLSKSGRRRARKLFGIEPGQPIYQDEAQAVNQLQEREERERAAQPPPNQRRVIDIVRSHVPKRSGELRGRDVEMLASVGLGPDFKPLANRAA